MELARGFFGDGTGVSFGTYSDMLYGGVPFRVCLSFKSLVGVVLVGLSAFPLVLYFLLSFGVAISAPSLFLFNSGDAFSLFS